MTKEENLKLLEALLEIENKILDKIKEQKDAQIKIQEQKIFLVLDFVLCGIQLMKYTKIRAFIN